MRFIPPWLHWGCDSLHMADTHGYPCTGFEGHILQKTSEVLNAEYADRGCSSGPELK